MTDPRPLEETIPQLQALLERSRDGRSEEVALLLVSRNVLEPLLALVEAAAPLLTDIEEVRDWPDGDPFYHSKPLLRFTFALTAVQQALSDALPEKGGDR